MRILFVSDTYYPHVNGVFYFVQRLAIELQNRGHVVAVAAASDTNEYKETSIDGIRILGVPSINLHIHPTLRLPTPFVYKGYVKRIIDDFKPDLIHLQSHFSLNTTVVELNRKLHLPLVATNHFMAENITELLKSAFLRKVLGKFLWSKFTKVFDETAVVTTPTETGAVLIRPFLKKVKVMAISNGIDLQKFKPDETHGDIRQKYGIPQKKILISVGRLEKEKHLSEVLDALVLTKNSDYCLVVVGKGPERESLEKQVLKLGIAERVVFAGYVPDEDLQHLYQISHCSVTASIAELQSLTTMEAMASGLPVVAADACALKELVHDGVNGYLYNPGDVAGLSARIDAIFDDESRRVLMGLESLGIISGHQMSRSVEAYEAVYTKITEGAVADKDSASCVET
jgi:1,2-diacylglycerol 3-alpha-glucosyltransferase